MSKAESLAIRFHEDSDLFQESVRFTAAETAFAARLIEKDYFCTVLLAYLAVEAGNDLIFKGGTCLAKVTRNCTDSARTWTLLSLCR